MSDSDSKPQDAKKGANAETTNWRPTVVGQEPATGQAVPPSAGEVTPADAGHADTRTAEQLRAELEQAQADASKYKEQLLRTAADFDNFRKRTRRDVEDAQRKSVERVLLEVLPVSDNLERAVQAAQQGGDVNSVIEGVTMVLRFFEDALGRLGVERVESVGVAFDPAVHEAVQQVESSLSPGTVVHEMTPGYRFSGKLLRAAMVTVSRPGASTSQQPS